MYIHFISYFIILFNSTHACVIILQYCNHKLSQFYFILRDKWKQTVFSKSFVKYMYTKSFGNLIIVLHVLLWLKWIWNWPCLTHSHKLCSMCLLQIIVKILSPNALNVLLIWEPYNVCEFWIWYFVAETLVLYVWFGFLFCLWKKHVWILCYGFCKSTRHHSKSASLMY